MELINEKCVFKSFKVSQIEIPKITIKLKHALSLCVCVAEAVNAWIFSKSVQKLFEIEISNFRDFLGLGTEYLRACHAMLNKSTSIL